MLERILIRVSMDLICKPGLSRENGVRAACSWARCDMLNELFQDPRLRRAYGLLRRLQVYRRVGIFGQLVSCFMATLVHLLWRLIERIWPEEDIELSPEFPSVVLAPFKTNRETNPEG